MINRKQFKIIDDFAMLFALGKTTQTIDDFIDYQFNNENSKQEAKQLLKDRLLSYNAKLNECELEFVHYWQDKPQETEAKKDLFKKVVSGQANIDEIYELLSIVHTVGGYNESDANNPDL